MKNKCSSEIPNMPTECAPDNRRPEKICGTCRYFNPEFPVNGKPAPVCLAIKEMKGGTEYSNPRGTQHYFRCSNGRYEIARYKSIREAERKTGIKNITITRCCKGVYKTAGDYVWEYDLTAKEI